MKILIVILALSCLAVGQTYTFSTNPPAATFGTSTTYYNGFPGIIRTPSGCLLAYRNGTAHATPPTYIILNVSTDGCVTFHPYAGTSFDCGGSPLSGCLWSDNSNSNQVEAAAFIYDGTRIISAAYLLNNAATVSTGCQVTYSDDYGASWTTPATYTAPMYWCFSPGFFTYNNHPCITTNVDNVSGGLQQWVCSLDHGVTWTDIHPWPAAIDQGENATYWIDNNNGIVFSRKAAGQTLRICVTTTGPTGFTCGDSNLTMVTPACAVSGGTLSSWIDVSPTLYAPTSAPGFVTLLYTERQVCTGGPSATNNYLRSITFNPATVIANTSALPAPQTINTGVPVNSQVDYGYQGMTETTGSNVMFTWYGHWAAGTTKPVIITMTGAYQTTSRTLTMACGGTGNGFLSSDDGHISCTCTAGTASGVCTDLTGSGSVVLVTGFPVANTGLQSFVTTGGCSASGTNPTSVTLSANCTTTATFTPLTPHSKLNGNSVMNGNSIVR